MGVLKSVTENQTTNPQDKRPDRFRARLATGGLPHAALARTIDDLEENELLKTRELLYQFSSRGHDMAQVILGSMLNHPRDGACGYYRSRAFMLSIGLPLEDAIAGPMMKKWWYQRWPRYRRGFQHAGERLGMLSAHERWRGHPVHAGVGVG